MGKMERVRGMVDPVEIRFRAPGQLKADLLKDASLPGELSVLIRELLKHGVKNRILVRSIITRIRTSPPGWATRGSSVMLPND
jgi:hypothetical protein